MFQVMCALMIAMVFTVLHIKHQPFDVDQDDNLQSCSLVSSVLTFWSAALILVGYPNCAKDIAGASPGLVGVFMALVNVLVLVLAMYVAVTVRAAILAPSLLA